MSGEHRRARRAIQERKAQGVSRPVKPWDRERMREDHDLAAIADDFDLARADGLAAGRVLRQLVTRSDGM